MAEALFSDPNFQIDRGWTGVVGANGSGKSTLLQLACALLLVSHDRRFLKKLTTASWHIKPDDLDISKFILNAALRP